jgi:hypothetical protein
MSTCPSCGAAGRTVPDRTLRAFLSPDRAAPLLAARPRFCRTPACAVVYYGEAGGAVRKPELPVRVGLKEPRDPIPLCYCFGFSRGDVRAEIAATGTTTIPTRIAAEIRAGRCACEVRNPSGACCLGDVNRAVEEELRCAMTLR